MLAVLVKDVVAAVSDDVSTWTCPAADPIFLATEVPGNDRVQTIAATPIDGEVYVLIEALVGDGSQLWLGRVEVSSCRRPRRA